MPFNASILGQIGINCGEVNVRSILALISPDDFQNGMFRLVEADFAEH